jgi:diguanylate cyclase (GGDEF)-like protein
MLYDVRSATIDLVCTPCLREALQDVGATPFAAVLLNLNLPDSSGIETYIRMRDTARDIPIVILSDLDNENTAVQAVQEGAQDYLLKGQVSDALLVRAIRYAIERNRMSQVVKNMTLVDDLTGLYNRQGLLTLGGQHLKTAARLGKTIAIITIDLDNMKRSNDPCGQQVGNLAVQETAALLRNTCRSADIVARLGGEEFVVLALLAESKDSAILRRRVEENLARNNAAAGRQYLLSLRFGVALHDPLAATSLEEEIDAAKERMYEQK